MALAHCAGVFLCVLLRWRVLVCVVAFLVSCAQHDDRPSAWAWLITGQSLFENNYELAYQHFMLLRSDNKWTKASQCLTQMQVSSRNNIHPPGPCVSHCQHVEGASTSPPLSDLFLCMADLLFCSVSVCGSVALWLCGSVALWLCRSNTFENDAMKQIIVQMVHTVVKGSAVAHAHARARAHDAKSCPWLQGMSPHEHAAPTLRHPCLCKYQHCACDGAGWFLCVVPRACYMTVQVVGTCIW